MFGHICSSILFQVNLTTSNELKYGDLLKKSYSIYTYTVCETMSWLKSKTKKFFIVSKKETTWNKEEEKLRSRERETEKFETKTKFIIGLGGVYSTIVGFHIPKLPELISDL